MSIWGSTVMELSLGILPHHQPFLMMLQPQVKQALCRTV